MTAFIKQFKAKGSQCEGSRGDQRMNYTKYSKLVLKGWNNLVILGICYSFISHVCLTLYKFHKPAVEAKKRSRSVWVIKA